MTLSRTAPAPAGDSFSPAGDYQPGVCNIGPAEIARRRQAGHIGLAVTLATLIVLIVLRVPPVFRLIVAVPAAGTAITYLQAVLHFCVAFGSRGVFNFGPLGDRRQIADPVARARDRARVWRMVLAGLAVGALVGVVAVALPL